MQAIRIMFATVIKTMMTDKTSLPVIQLKFGDTRSHGNRSEEGYHTLGKLKCFGTELTPIDPS